MDNLRGSLFMLAAMAGFAIEDMLIKQMAGAMPVGQVVILIGAAGAVFFGGIGWLRGERLLSRQIIHPAMLLRNAAEAFATFGFIAAIALSSLSVASAILQATPLLVTLGAAVFLGEAVGWRRWLAIFVGLIGVLMIIQPGAADFAPASLLALLGAVGLAARDIATRRIPPGITSGQVSFCAFAVSILTGAALMWAGVTGTQWVTPAPADQLRLAAAILVSFGAYFAIVLATRIGDVAAVSPFRYARLVFALIIGALVFGERPDALTLLGAFVVVVSGLYTLWRETHLNRHKAAL